MQYLNANLVSRQIYNQGKFTFDANLYLRQIYF